VIALNDLLGFMRKKVVIRAAKALLRSSVLVHFSIVAFARCRYVSASVLLEVVGASKSLAAVRTFESLLSRVCTNVSL